MNKTSSFGGALSLMAEGVFMGIKRALQRVIIDVLKEKLLEKETNEEES